MDTDLERVKQIILGEEYDQLLKLRDDIRDDGVFSQIVSDVISEALKKRSVKDNSVAEILAPTIDRAISSSIDQDPKKLAESLYPIMGPAIRKSISETLQQMLDNFNQLLEESLSPQSLRWRFDAWRTGRPYSELVMLNTLEYRVEQVFLIHRETSLLVQHHFSDLADTKDPDMVSGMLSAIQDFIEDSFSTQEGDLLDTLKLGELSVVLQRGPNAVLAAVVRGRVPEHIRLDLSTTLEYLHRIKRAELQDYAGDPADFDDVQDDLLKLLQSELREPKKKEIPWLALFAILLGLIAGGVYFYFQNQEDILRSGLVTTLSEEPGIVILSTKFEDSIFSIDLLADPHAREPSDVIQTDHEGFSVTFRQYSHLSAVDQIILRRARDLLQPATNTVFEVSDKVLHVSGSATDRWMQVLDIRWPAVMGLNSVDLSRLTTTYPRRVAIRKSIAIIESMELKFDKGEIEFAVDNILIQSIAEEILKLNRLSLEEQGSPIRIDIVGYTDETGTQKINQRIGLGRATSLKEALVKSGVTNVEIRVYSALDFSSIDEVTERKTRILVHK